MSKNVPVRVTSLKTGANEPEIHVMLFDMEALICHLLVEETKTQKSELLGSWVWVLKIVVIVAPLIPVRLDWVYFITEVFIVKPVL